MSIRVFVLLFLLGQQFVALCVLDLLFVLHRLAGRPDCVRFGLVVQVRLLLLLPRAHLFAQLDLLKNILHVRVQGVVQLL